MWKWKVGVPGRRCPTVSARLPFFTLVMKAQSLPDSVIFPPTTCQKGSEVLVNVKAASDQPPHHTHRSHILRERCDDTYITPYIHDIIDFNSDGIEMYLCKCN